MVVDGQWAGVFDRAEARRRGITEAQIRSRLRRRRWVALRRGLYADASWVAEVGTCTALIAAAVCCTGGRGVASHQSAGLLHGLPLPAASGSADVQPIFLTVPLGCRISPQSRTGLVVHRAALADADLGRVVGVPVTSVARTVVDLARCLPFDRALASADAALRGRLARQELQSALDRCAGWPGSCAARKVVRHATPEAETPIESLARAVCLELGLAVEPQVDVYDDDGNFIGRVDLLERGLGLVIEADGRLKYADPQALYAEKLRQEALEAAGLVVVRLSWDDLVRYPAVARRRVLQAIRRAAAMPSPRVLYPSGDHFSGRQTP